VGRRALSAIVVRLGCIHRNKRQPGHGILSFAQIARWLDQNDFQMLAEHGLQADGRRLRRHRLFRERHGDAETVPLQRRQRRQEGIKLRPARQWRDFLVLLGLPFKIPEQGALEGPDCSDRSRFNRVLSDKAAKLSHYLVTRVEDDRVGDGRIGVEQFQTHTPSPGVILYNTTRCCLVPAGQSLVPEAERLTQ